MPYIGKRMSVNAKSAHDRGLMPISTIGRKELDKCGFRYSVSFFRWLCRKEYIYPREYHHTGAAKRMTKFYSPENIRVFAERANLSILYDIYRNKLTYREAVENLDLRYFKAECVRSVLGVHGTGSVYLFVVYYKGAYYISKKKKLLEKYLSPNQFRIVAEYKKGDPGWESKRGKEIEQYILLYRAKNERTGLRGGIRIAD